MNSCQHVHRPFCGGVEGHERLTPQQRRLAEDHWPDARRIAAYYRRRYRRDLDWEGACSLALCQAARTFDPARGLEFAPLLACRLHGACIDLLRNSGPMGYRRRDNFEAPQIEPLLAPPVAEEPPVGWDLEWHDLVEGLAALLTPDQGRALRRLFLHADSRRQNRAAEALDLSASQVTRLVQGSLRQLRQIFDGPDLVRM
jgi:DNA-directed RNA polymerase specialized sigma subunit